MTHHLSGLVSLPPLYLCSLSCTCSATVYNQTFGCCGRRWLALHAFADVFKGCYRNGTNGTKDCRYFAGLYLVLRVLMLAMYGGIAYLTCMMRWYPMYALSLQN